MILITFFYLPGSFKSMINALRMLKKWSMRMMVAAIEILSPFNVSSLSSVAF